MRKKGCCEVRARIAMKSLETPTSFPFPLTESSNENVKKKIGKKPTLGTWRLGIGGYCSYTLHNPVDFQYSILARQKYFWNGDLVSLQCPAER